VAAEARAVSDLASDLAHAKMRAANPNPCKACVYLDTMTPGVEKDQVKDAMAGSIGINTLVDIFRRHGIPVARRAIETHRAHLREA
jgi:hypothetical protein